MSGKGAFVQLPLEFLLLFMYDEWSELSFWAPFSEKVEILSSQFFCPNLWSRPPIYNFFNLVLFLIQLCLPSKVPRAYEHAMMRMNSKYYQICLKLYSMNYENFCSSTSLLNCWSRLASTTVITKVVR